MSLPSVKLLHLELNLRNSPDSILKDMVTTTRSKVTSRSHHDLAHLQPPTNVPTKYQLPTPRYSPDKILLVKVTTAKSNQGHTMTLHTYNQPMSLPSINFLYLMVRLVIYYSQSITITFENIQSITITF